jgi:hypothetical protein
MLGSDDTANSHFIQMESPWKNTCVLKGFWIGMLCFFLITLPIVVDATDYSEMIYCDINHGTCTQKLQDMDVILDISPKPVKAMKDLKFTITLTGKQGVSEPFIDLGMPGMKMGPNRVFLKSNGKGIYSGTGTIVRCPSGKKIWKATVTVPDRGSVEFIFDVIY